MRITTSIVRQHAELAAILWAQRETLSGEDLHGHRSHRGHHRPAGGAPRRAADCGRRRVALQCDFDERYFQAAPPDQQFDALAEGMTFGCLHMNGPARFALCAQHGRTLAGASPAVS